VKCIEDEIPFDIPNGWIWCRLSQIITLFSGQDLDPSRYNNEGNGIPYITGASNLEDGKVAINRWTDSPTTHATDGDLLITCKGSGVGKMAWCDICDAHIARQIMALRCVDGLLSGFLEIVISAMLSNIRSKANGLIPGLSREIILEMMFPLPSLEEQKRICSKSREILSYIDGLNSQKSELVGSVSILKSKILDLAIRGQLVPQDPNDEPASVLLERIRAEKEELIKQGKLKRDKKESVIFRGEDNSYYEKIDMEVRCINSEIPFDLPETWCWCRLGTLFAHNTGKALNSADSAGTPMTYITTSNLYWDRFELDSLKEMLFADSEIDKCTVKKGDLLVCEGGDIGRSAIWMFEENIRIQNHIHRLRPYISLSSRFYYYVMYMWKQLGLIGGQGIGLQGFSSKMLHNLIVPLPSIDEQERIVAFIDKLFEQIESIEKSFS